MSCKQFPEQSTASRPVQGATFSTCESRGRAELSQRRWFPSSEPSPEALCGGAVHRRGRRERGSLGTHVVRTAKRKDEVERGYRAPALHPLQLRAEVVEPDDAVRVDFDEAQLLQRPVRRRHGTLRAEQLAASARKVASPVRQPQARGVATRGERSTAARGTDLMTLRSNNSSDTEWYRLPGTSWKAVAVWRARGSE